MGLQKYVFALVPLLLAACLPIPQVRLDLTVAPASYRLDPQDVSAELVSLAGYPEPSTPEAYNRALYVRYFETATAPDITAEPDVTVATHPKRTVLVLVPGIFGGASSVDLLARQLVAATPGLEVWALERRANLLEDRSRFLTALETGDPYPAFDYYVTDYGEPDGFNPVPPDTVPFLRNWSLAVHLRDLHVVVKRARQQVDAVVLGGHSLGASIAGYYAAYNFAADIAVTDSPEDTVPVQTDEVDPGHAYIDGLFLIDGVLGRTGGFDRDPVGLALGALDILPGTEQLRQGEGAPYLTFGVNPRYNAGRETLALLAQLAPDDLAPAGFYSFPLTNRAALALTEDDSYAPSVVFSSSIGQATGATFGGNLTAALLGWDGIYSSTVSGTAPGAARVGWQGGDPLKDVSTLEDVVRAWTRPYSNRSEWYFPLRLALDIAQYNLLLEDEAGFVPTAQVRTPTLAVGAGRGLVTSLEGFSAYSNARFGSLFSSYVIPYFTHLDIVQATSNPLVPLFGVWLEQVTR